MSHLTESLNDLLEPNFTASDNSYKKGRRGYKITRQLVFHAVSYPPSIPKRGKTGSYKRFGLKSKYLYLLNSRYLIISKI